MFLCAFFISPSPFSLNLDRRILGLTQLSDPQPLLCPLLRSTALHTASHRAGVIHPPVHLPVPIIHPPTAHLLQSGCFLPPHTDVLVTPFSISLIFFFGASSVAPFLHHDCLYLPPPLVSSHNPLFCPSQLMIHTPLISCMILASLSSPLPILCSCSRCLMCSVISTPVSIFLFLLASTFQLPGNCLYQIPDSALIIPSWRSADSQPISLHPSTPTYTPGLQSPLGSGDLEKSCGKIFWEFISVK